MHIATDDLVYIYTKGAQEYPSYRLGILNALCYPAGHILRYKYRKKNIHPDLLLNERTLEGRSGVIVFVDSLLPKDPVTYYPIRKVKIVQHLVPKIEGAGNQGEGRQTLALRLGEYVDYGPEEAMSAWNNAIAENDGIRQVVDGKPQYFVIPASDRISFCGLSGGDEWERIVKAVSSSKNFREGVFLKVEHPRQVEPPGVQLDLESLGLSDMYYQFRPGGHYRLDVTVFGRGNEASKGATPKLVVESSSKLIQVTQPFQSIVSGLSEQSLVVACSRTVEKHLSTLDITVDEESSGIVNSPRPILFVQMSVSGVFLFCLFTLFALGSFLVAIDREVLVALPWHTCWIRFPAQVFGLKTIGALLLGWAAFLGLRKLPLS